MQGGPYSYINLTSIFITSNKNVISDALSRRAYLLTIVKNEIVSFDTLKELYAGDADFGPIWIECTNNQLEGDSLIEEGSKVMFYVCLKHP